MKPDNGYFFDQMYIDSFDSDYAGAGALKRWVNEQQHFYGYDDLKEDLEEASLMDPKAFQDADDYEC